MLMIYLLLLLLPFRHIDEDILFRKRKDNSALQTLLGDLRSRISMVSAERRRVLRFFDVRNSGKSPSVLSSSLRHAILSFPSAPLGDNQVISERRGEVSLNLLL